MRCFAHLNRRPDAKLACDLPDIELVKEWSLDGLPWDAFTAGPGSSGEAPADLDPKSLEAVEKFLSGDGLSARAHVAAMSIIYLYMAIGRDQER